ncbi:MAG: 1-acylglycerol-3-phosphate O-acyltransferase [Acidobacteriales bacterium]|nr:1-acylglycerol-3-phosphate O-acyltransferase [Terriglobales bacterium]
MVGFFAVAAVPCALVMFPWLWITGDAERLYRVGTWIGITGVRLAGVRVRLIGLDRFDHNRSYIFMSNHVSNLDPPVVIPNIPQRVSVLAKASLFRIPLLGYAMSKASLIPVHRENREAAIQSIHNAVEVLRQGLSIVIFPEGTRSRTGELLPFKKGPFYMAEEAGVPVVPITVRNTAELMPKGKFEVRRGTVEVIFHDPIEPAQCTDREELMSAVRNSILSGMHSVPSA